MTAQPTPERALHPIAKEATAGLEMTPRGIELDRDCEEQLRTTLILSGGSEEIRWAVRSLLTLAARLEAEGGRPAADALIQIACSATSALAQVGASAGTTQMRSALRKLSTFRGTRERSSAPEEQQTQRHQRRGLIAQTLATRPLRA